MAEDCSSDSKGVFKLNIDVKVIGTFCNSWPNLIIELNDKTIYDDVIVDTQVINLQVNNLLDKNNKIILGMKGKKFGKNKVWDTKVENNKIIADKTIKILSLKLDEVECKDLFNSQFHVKRSDQQPSYFPDTVESSDTMHYNGYFGFSFDLPLYKSLINKKFSNKSEDEISYFSNYTKVFHYDEEIKIITEIEENLKKIDEKFSNQRAKIRNT